MQIAVVPRRLPVEARFIQKLFKLKYAHLSGNSSNSKTEAETAEIFLAGPERARVVRPGAD